ncbi:hypothetical protein AC230_14180 [Streptomyces caatingaensis]|uniref:peptide chain release factor N(5)-glutamine methyltransferase n=1 Tax=Streptomyces caatingaensis TaxID=1678637 RepID=A0A0K9XEZ6_9ACTN|nr:hypothetical protein AC230_14180 [Streptomyces caatingaensis]
MPEGTHVRPPLTASLVARLRAAGCVFAEDEAELLLSTARTPDELDTMARRRCAGEPLELVLGWAEFRGLRIAVAPGVFVPRRRTEFLADRAAALARPGSVVVDLCCGSGAVATALAAAVPGLGLHAADIDPAAVRCARRNLGEAGRVYEGDLYAALPSRLRGRVDVLVANTPYVPTADIPLLPPEARDHEPLVTLDGGADGLEVQRRVADRARSWLAPGGSLLVETSERQAVRLMGVFAGAGLVPRLVRHEELDAHVVIGVRPGWSASSSSPRCPG